MRIAMMGSGGVGGYFGGRMAAAGADVSFIARGQHLESIRKNGLRIDSRDRGNTLVHPTTATDNPMAVGPVDYVIVGVKLWDTIEAGKAILPMLGSDTTVGSSGVFSTSVVNSYSPMRTKTRSLPRRSPKRNLGVVLITIPPVPTPGGGWFLFCLPQK